MRRFNMCFRNNIFLLHKAFCVAPCFIILFTFIRVVAGVRTTFMNVYFLTHIIASFEEGGDWKNVLVFVFVSFVLVVITYAAEVLFNQIYKPISIEKIGQSLQKSVFQKARATDLEVYDTEKHYTSMTLANNEIDSRMILVIENVFGLVEIIVTIITIVGYSLSLDPIVPIVAVVSFGVSLFMNNRISSFRVKYDENLQKINKERSMFHRIMYLPDYAKDIRLTHIRDVISKRYQLLNERKEKIICEQGGKISFWSIWETVLGSAICIDFIVPVYLTFRILVQKTLSASQFMGVVNGCSQLQLKLECLSKELGLFNQNGEMIERYRDFLSKRNLIESSPCVEVSKKMDVFQTLEFQKVGFNYQSNTFGVNDIDFCIKRGEKIAIVGPNGCGKTTLIKLLLRLYDCQTGAILFNGIPIRKIDASEYRGVYSVLFQDFSIYALPLNKNIAMNSKVDEKKIAEVTHKVGLDEVLPYAHVDLTRELSDGGVSFSGGQLQRVALARVLYENRDFVIMDEPTSSVDVVFEKQFYDIVLREFREKTVLFVSHRLSSVMLCDRIYYMEQGQILESGNHNELMAKNGGYAKLFRAQTELYFNA